MRLEPRLHGQSNHDRLPAEKSPTARKSRDDLGHAVSPPRALLYLRIFAKARSGNLEFSVVPGAARFRRHPVVRPEVAGLLSERPAASYRGGSMPKSRIVSRLSSL